MPVRTEGGGEPTGQDRRSLRGTSRSEGGRQLVPVSCLVVSKWQSCVTWQEGVF